MKLGRANELAQQKGVPALIESGTIVQTGRHRWKVIRVRGSTVTAAPWPFWHQRAAARAARAAARVAIALRIRRPVRKEKAPEQTLPGMGSGTVMYVKPGIFFSYRPLWILLAVGALSWALIVEGGRKILEVFTR